MSEPRPTVVSFKQRLDRKRKRDELLRPVEERAGRDDTPSVPQEDQLAPVKQFTDLATRHTRPFRILVLVPDAKRCQAITDYLNQDGKGYDITYHADDYDVFKADKWLGAARREGTPFDLIIMEDQGEKLSNSAERMIRYNYGQHTPMIVMTDNEALFTPLKNVDDRGFSASRGQLDVMSPKPDFSATEEGKGQLQQLAARVGHIMREVRNQEREAVSHAR